MSHPLVILGAGASFDYIHQDEEDPEKSLYKPPLVADIFSKRIRSVSTGIIGRYTEMEPLIGELNTAIRNGRDFEQHLTAVRDRSPERKGQLVALQYYLHELFRLISNKYNRQTANNYSVLVNQIKEFFGEACFVSFNYDTLFDQTLFPKKEVTNINTYVSDNYKLIKIHGSCNWVYQIPIHLDPNDKKILYGELIKNSEVVEQISNNDNIQIWNSSNPDYGYPAIALPLADKSDTHFVCPKQHIEYLRDAISKTDRILIIGWNANDKVLIKMIKDNLKKPTRLYIVCGNAKNTIKSIQDKFKKINLVKIIEQTDNAFTFSAFPNSSYWDEFMKNRP